MTGASVASSLLPLVSAELPTGRRGRPAVDDACDLRRLVFGGRIVIARAVDQVLAARDIRPVKDHTDTGQEVSDEPTTATLTA